MHVLFPAHPVRAGASFLAFPGSPVMYEANGRVLNRKSLLLRQLKFLGRDSKGTYRFRLDDTRIVNTKSKNPFSTVGFVPLTETKGLHGLQRQYVGRRVWTYGTITAGYISPPGMSLRPGQAVRITRIYRLAVPQDSPIVNESQGRVTGTRISSLDGPFLVMFALFKPKSSVLGGSGRKVAPNRRNLDSQNYSPGYQIIDQGWLLEQMYSLAPPSASARRAIKKVSKSPGSFATSLLGFTHLQTAWAYGWPKEPPPLSRLLRQSRWSYDDIELIDFKGDRVVSFGQRIPH